MPFVVHGGRSEMCGKVLGERFVGLQVVVEELQAIPFESFIRRCHIDVQ